MADNIRAVVKLEEASYSTGDIVTVKVFARHPMDTGFEVNKATGKLKEAYYINNITATFGGKEVTSIDVDVSTAKNPLFRFKMKVPGAGDLKVVITDNTGATSETTLAIQPK